MARKNIKQGKYEGLQNNIRKIRTPAIEVWDNQYKDRRYTVYIRTDEFSCICPKTGLPDIADISIEYVPDRHCVELKSFKFYLVSFRNIGIFHEHVANRILDDFVKACRPLCAKITAVFKSRGGIQTTVGSVYEKNR
ncbi:MAG: preQ(1) synthase [Candidatus Omnitrophica bacterium]|nr:preQ(1) synthase [Candidatus Omnitrophota bacterium]